MDCITPKGTINYVILVDVIDIVSVLLEWTLPCLYMYIVQGVASWSVFSGGGGRLTWNQVTKVMCVINENHE